MRAQALVLFARTYLNCLVMQRVVESLSSRHDGPIRFLSDSNLPANLEAETKNFLVPERVNRETAAAISNSGIFVSTLTYSGPEKELLRYALRQKTPCFALLTDSGSGAEKFFDKRGGVFPDRIGVADRVTHDLLIRRGLPRERIRTVGSPQLDVSVLNGLLPPLPPGPLRVGHLATPNRHDWCKPELCCDYDEQDVLQGICGALAEIRGANLCVRLHPRHLRGKNPLPVLPANVSLDPVEQRSSVDDFVARHHIIIGSYSSSLLSARLRGRPTISYQPQRGKVIRGEILSAAGISVARCSKQLVEILECSNTPSPPEPSKWLYHPGRSVNRIVDEILELAETAT